MSIRKLINQEVKEPISTAGAKAATAALTNLDSHIDGLFNKVDNGGILDIDDTTKAALATVKPLLQWAVNKSTPSADKNNFIVDVVNELVIPNLKAYIKEAIKNKMKKQFKVNNDLNELPISYRTKHAAKQDLIGAKGGTKQWLLRKRKVTQLFTRQNSGLELGGNAKSAQVYFRNIYVKPTP